MPLPEQLTHLETAGLIRLAELRPEEIYGFRHALIHDATYQSVLKSDRRALHKLVGEILETAAGLSPHPLAQPSLPADLAARLARHFAEAGEKAHALTYYVVAAAAAAQTYANTEAGELYTAAWQLVQGLAADQVPGPTLLQLCSGLGRVLELQGQHPAARTHYEALLAYARQQALPALELKALQGLATLLATLTPLYEPVFGEQLAQQALALAQTLQDAEAESEVLWCLMQVYLYTGRVATAQRYGQQALDLTSQATQPRRWALICNDLSRCYSGLGQPTQALALLSAAHTIWQRIGDVPMLADNLGRLSEVHYWLGLHAFGLQHAQAGVRLAETIHNFWSVAVDGWMVAHLSWERGAIGAALQAYQQSVAAAETIQLRFVLSLMCVELSWTYHLLGDVAQSVAFEKQAFGYCATQGNVVQRNVHAVAGRVALLRGELATAGQHFQAALADLRADDFSAYTVLHVGLGQMELALQQGEPQQALQMGETFLATLRRCRVRLGVPEALQLQASAYRALGQLPVAYACLQAAQAEAEALGARWALWSILADLSVVAEALGETLVSPSARAQAQGIVRAIHAELPPNLQASWAKQPTVAHLL